MHRMPVGEDRPPERYERDREAEAEVEAVAELGRVVRGLGRAVRGLASGEVAVGLDASATSLAAAGRARMRAGSVRMRVLAVVAAADPMVGVSDAELLTAVGLAGLGANTVRPRRVELASAGLVWPVVVGGRPLLRAGCQCWRVTVAGRRALAEVRAA